MGTLKERPPEYWNVTTQLTAVCCLPTKMLSDSVKAGVRYCYSSTPNLWFLVVLVLQLEELRVEIRPGVVDFVGEDHHFSASFRVVRAETDLRSSQGMTVSQLGIEKSCVTFCIENSPLLKLFWSRISSLRTGSQTLITVNWFFVLFLIYHILIS